MNYLLLIRVAIAIFLLVLAVEDFKTISVNAILFKIIVVLQFVGSYINIINGDDEGFKTRALVALVILFIYYMIFDFSNILGEGDIWFYAFQLISLKGSEFVLFWFSHLVFAIIFGLYFRIKGEKKVPLYPSYFLSEILIIWRMMWKKKKFY